MKSSEKNIFKINNSNILKYYCIQNNLYEDEEEEILMSEYLNSKKEIFLDNEINKMQNFIEKITKILKNLKKEWEDTDTVEQENNSNRNSIKSGGMENLMGINLLFDDKKLTKKREIKETKKVRNVESNEDKKSYDGENDNNDEKKFKLIDKQEFFSCIDNNGLHFPQNQPSPVREAQNRINPIYFSFPDESNLFGGNLINQDLLNSLSFL